MHSRKIFAEKTIGNNDNIIKVIIDKDFQVKEKLDKQKKSLKIKLR